MLLNILQFTRANPIIKIYSVQNIYNIGAKKTRLVGKETLATTSQGLPLGSEMRSLVSLNLIRLEKIQILPMTYQLHEGVSIIMEN